MCIVVVNLDTAAGGCSEREVEARAPQQLYANSVSCHSRMITPNFLYFVLRSVSCPSGYIMMMAFYVVDNVAGSV